MSDLGFTITVTTLMAAAADALRRGGFQRISKISPAWSGPSSRLYENDYSVVGVCVFESCGQLISSWPELQASMVEIISHTIGQDEAKAWDGYLVLLTVGLAPSETPILNAIRYDTKRLRKIVATGDDLRQTPDVEKVLSPLLPLVADHKELAERSSLDLLPSLLSANNIPIATTTAIIDAFRQHESMMDRLHTPKRIF